MRPTTEAADKPPMPPNGATWAQRGRVATTAVLERQPRREPKATEDARGGRRTAIEAEKESVSVATASRHEAIMAARRPKQSGRAARREERKGARP